MVEVPAIREVVPRWGDVTAVACLLLFLFLIGTHLVFQDFRDEGCVGLGGDEDGWHL